MKLKPPQNNNYCATVVRLKNIVKLDNCDNVVATTIFGFQAIVNKNAQVGDIGLVFPAETQLSEDYCYENNLFRHSEKNKDVTQKGYIEDNRRIKAVKFRGNPSSCLFMPLESLKYLGIKVKDFNEGDEFDEIDDKEICKKYFVPVKAVRGNHQPKAKQFTRVDTKFIPEHFTTDNYFKNDRNIDPETEIIVTQKIHGTSVRIANTIVKRKKTIRDYVASVFGVKIQETEFDMVYGSRKVIKDINNPNQNHYYETDLWTDEGKKLIGLVPTNFLVYAEIVGWTSTGAPIQVNYTYNYPLGTCELFVYRVAFVNNDGLVVDLSWDGLKQFCNERGLKYVPELWVGKHKDFVVTDYLDTRLKDKFPNALPLDKDVVDEGICIRVDRLTPYILKAKSPIFYEHESALYDKGAEDLESNQSENA
jgi:hypothetical protein